MKLLSRLCLCTMFLLAAASPIQAQPGRVAPITKANIPEDAVGHVSVRVQQIVQHPMLELVPWEIVTAAGLDNYGFDPTAIERVDVIFGFLDEPQLKWCAVVTLTQDWKLLEGTRIDVDKLTPMLGNSGLSLISMNPKQVAVGTGDYFKNVATVPAREGELAKQVARIAQTGFATAIFVPAPVRERIDEELANAPPQSQATIRTLVANMQMVALRLELDPKPSVPVVVESATPESTQKFAAAWKELLEQIFIQSDLGTKSLGPINTPVKAASAAYSQRFQQELLHSLTPTVTGNRLIVRLDTKLVQLIQCSSFMPAINAAIVAGDRMR